MKSDFTNLRVEHQTPVPHASSRSDAGERVRRAARRPLAKLWVGTAIAIAAFGTAWLVHLYRDSGAVAHADSAAPQVVASKPLVRELNSRLGFLGQFSAVDEVELRAQVGGTLTEINFRDGEIVHKGDLLFTIDARPYEIKLAEATAQLETATARFALSDRELDRAQMLRRSGAGTAENVDQRMSDQRAAQASVDDAKAQIRDAQFDIEHCRITAPFTGRIGKQLAPTRVDVWSSVNFHNALPGMRIPTFVETWPKRKTIQGLPPYASVTAILNEDLPELAKLRLQTKTDEE